MARVLAIGVAVGWLTALCGAATIYVNGDTGSDDWDGLCETCAGGDCGPKATIQAGVVHPRVSA